MDFHSFLTGLHNLTRWLVVLAGLLALFTMLSGLSGRKFGPGDRRAGLIYTIVLDVQLLLGLLLFFVSPYIQAGMQNMGSAMSDSTLRFFMVEHTLMMVLAVVAGHIGSAMGKKADLPDRTRFLRAAIFYAISLALIAFATPWGRSLIPWA